MVAIHDVVPLANLSISTFSHMNNDSCLVSRYIYKRMLPTIVQINYLLKVIESNHHDHKFNPIRCLVELNSNG